MLNRRFPKLFKKNGELRRVGWDRTTPVGWVKRNFQKLNEAREKAAEMNANIESGAGAKVVVYASVIITIHEDAKIFYTIKSHDVDLMDLCEMVHSSSLMFGTDYVIPQNEG